MRSLTLIGLSLALGCEAPRSSEPGREIRIAEPLVAPIELPAVEPPPLDPGVRARLEQMLTGPGFIPDAAALKALGSGTLEALASIAGDEEAPPELRARALTALSFLGDPRAGAELVQALQASKSPLLVRTALFGLGRASGNAALPQIIPFLADPNPNLRLAAAETLGHLGGPAARRALQPRLASETDPAVREALTRLLGKPNP
jgi:HEAT repeats